jgi:hypothetical protein
MRTPAYPLAAQQVQREAKLADQRAKKQPTKYKKKYGLQNQRDMKKPKHCE